MKICVITGSRAEYGLLKNIIHQIKKDRDLHLKLVVTGSHLSKKFGNTYKEITQDGFKIDKKINIKLKSSTVKSIVNSINLCMSKLVDVYKKIQPNIIIVLGDRYESFAATVAACISRIPIAHIHGGEATEGLIDESLRHSMTKMSHIHFVAAEEYKKKVIQLGEKPKNVFLVGGLGVDSIKNLKLLNKKDLESQLSFKFNEKNLLINFHPETLNKNYSIKFFNSFLNELKKLKNTNLIFTMSNSDVDGDYIISSIKKFSKKHKNVFLFKSIGQLNYLSLLKYVDGMVGNSSSGLLEMPSFKKGSINIGNRQLGRLKSTSVIDTNYDINEIKKSIKFLYSKKFKKILKFSKNPYGEGGASKKIVSILKKIKLKNILIKKFYLIS